MYVFTFHLFAVVSSLLYVRVLCITDLQIKMLKDVKMKSVFKIVTFCSAVVIFCYLESKFGLVFKGGENSSMAGLRILQAEFEVFGIVQGEAKNLILSECSL